jgi:hypothetical protein
MSSAHPATPHITRARPSRTHLSDSSGCPQHATHPHNPATMAEAQKGTFAVKVIAAGAAPRPPPRRRRPARPRCRPAPRSAASAG